MTLHGYNGYTVTIADATDTTSGLWVQKVMAAGPPLHRVWLEAYRTQLPSGRWRTKRHRMRERRKWWHTRNPDAPCALRVKH